MHVLKQGSLQDSTQSSLVPGKPKASQPLPVKKPYTRKLLDRDAPDPNESPSLPQDYYAVPPLTPAIAWAATARKPLQPMSTFDSFMALTVVVLLMVLLFMGFFSIYIRRFTEENVLELCQVGEWRGDEKEKRRRREEEYVVTGALSLSMIRRSSVAADGGRVWCMGRVRWKEIEERNQINGAFCLCSRPVRARGHKPVRRRVNRSIEPTRPR
uniref:Uncharacterized protein n=1 Tax=Nelumbo nucifera TaxID=4432 RepID=A0A822Y9A0_NELNU|nr:TPA_asm: hypothetical protein HUJ06_029609 [Nelumbo nucifera]